MFPGFWWFYSLTVPGSGESGQELQRDSCCQKGAWSGMKEQSRTPAEDSLTNPVWLQTSHPFIMVTLTAPFWETCKKVHDPVWHREPVHLGLGCAQQPHTCRCWLGIKHWWGADQTLNQWWWPFASKELGSSHPPALSGLWWGWSFGTFWNKTCSEAYGSSSSESLALLPAIHHSLAGESSVVPLLSTPVQPHFSLPVYSGKQILSGDFLIFSSNMSFLFRNRMIDVSVNHLLLQMLSKSFRDSCMRFCNRKERSHQAKVSDPGIFNM